MTTKDNGRSCAVKVMDKSVIRSHNMKRLVMREKQIMTSIAVSSHPIANPLLGDMFVRMITAFQTKQCLFLAMEYVHGGDCLSMLAMKGRFTEQVAQHSVAELVMAYLHQNIPFQYNNQPTHYLSIYPLTLSSCLSLHRPSLPLPSLHLPPHSLKPPSLPSPTHSPFNPFFR